MHAEPLARRTGGTCCSSLIRRADVLIENFRPGKMEAWRLGERRAARVHNPRLIIVRVTGFGQDGPEPVRSPGFGTIAEAMSGLASVC